MVEIYADVSKAFQLIGVPEDKAMKAATALTSSLAKAEKGFSRQDANIEAIRKEIGSIKLDIVGMRRKLVPPETHGLRDGRDAYATPVPHPHPLTRAE